MQPCKIIQITATTAPCLWLAPWLNWIEQPPPKGQVTGSSPVGVTIFAFTKISGPTTACVFEHRHRFDQTLTKAQIIFEISKPSRKH